MKILFHIPLDVVGGAELQLRYLLKHLPEIQPIITYQFDQVKPFIASLNVLSTHQVKTYHQLGCVINETKPDIVQFYHSGMMYLALRAVKKTFKTIEIVHNAHHFPGDSTTYPKDKTDFLVFVSEDARDNYFKRQQMMPHSIVGNGVDAIRFNKELRAKFKPNPTPIFGYHGRLEAGPGKGIMQLFEIFKGRRDAQLHLVGQDLGNWEGMAREFPNITVFDHDPNPEKHLAKWDVFISRSPIEGFGMSIAEALQMGVPSILYDCGGITRGLQDHKGCRLVKSDAEIKALVDRAVMSPAMLEISNADYDFSSEKMGKMYSKLYGILTGEKINLRKLDIPVEAMETGHIEVLSTAPGDWAGVAKSLSSFSNKFVPLEQILNVAKSVKPKKIIFGGMHPQWKKLVFDLRGIVRQIEVSLQGMPMLHDFHIANFDALKTTKELLELQAIDRVTTPNQEWARVLATLGIPAIYQENTLKDPGTREQRPGFNIGVFGSNQPWKNLTTQVIGAHIYGQRHPEDEIEIHTQLNIAIPFLQKCGAKITEYGRLPEEMFLPLSGSMTINCAVGLTDTFGYNCVESFLMGVPCLFSPMTAAMEDAPAQLRQLAMVTNVHSPEWIAEGIDKVYGDYELVKRLGKEFCQRYVR